MKRAFVVLMVLVCMLAGGQVLALDTEIGHTDIMLNGMREHVRTQETNLGNLVTDALRHYTGADIALYNGGGIRDSADMGAITLETAMAILAFENNVVAIEMTVAQIIEALELGVSSYPEVAGKFLQVSGLRFFFDPNRPAGERVVKLYIGGQHINLNDMNKTFVVVTNDFLVAGGDEYTMFAEGKELEVFDTIDTQMFIQYIQENSPLFPKVEGRIIALQ